MARRRSRSPRRRAILAYLRRPPRRTASTATSASSTGSWRRPGPRAEARWQVEVERIDTGERTAMTAGWLFCAGGYYRYDEGYTPQFAGRERFAGPIVHPQHWPEDLDYAGKRVVVIGSGATAVTLVPAMAEQAAHVTMLQRTPSYVVPVPTEDAIANVLRRVLGEERGYALTRRKNIAMQRTIWRFCRRFPTAARALIRRVNARQLPEGYPVDEHFNPPYDPWDQRLCVVPDGDLFKAIRDGEGVGGHRPDRDLHRAGILLGVRPRARGRHHRHRHRARTCSFSAACALTRRRRDRSTRPRPWPTRA